MACKRALIFLHTRDNSYIDNALTNFGNKFNVKVSPLDFHISDHKAISLKISKYVSDDSESARNVPYRPISDYGKYKFFNLLNNVNWEFLNSKSKVCDKLSYFLNTFLYYFEAFPIKLYYKSSYKCKIVYTRTVNYVMC